VRKLIVFHEEKFNSLFCLSMDTRAYGLRLEFILYNTADHAIKSATMTLVRLSERDAHFSKASHRHCCSAT